MKIFIEIYKINGVLTLSKNVSFDGGFYNIDALWRLWATLEDRIRKRKEPAIKFLTNETQKKYGVNIALDNDGEYKILQVSQDIRLMNEEIVNDVAEFFRVRYEDLFQKSRVPKMLKPRQFSTFLLFFVNKESLSGIARLFNMNHATVIHSIRNSIPSYFMSNDPTMTQAIEYFSFKYNTDLRRYLLAASDQKLGEVIRNY